MLMLTRRSGGEKQAQHRPAGSFVLAAAIGATLAAVALTGCDVIVEKHCSPGEIVISNTSGGGRCELGTPGDRACPDEQVLERQPELKRERCIPDRIDRPVPASTEWLPSTED